MFAATGMNTTGCCNEYDRTKDSFFLFFFGYKGMAMRRTAVTLACVSSAAAFSALPSMHLRGPKSAVVTDACALDRYGTHFLEKSLNPPD